MKTLSVLSMLVFLLFLSEGCSPSAEKKSGMIKEDVGEVMHNTVTINPSRSFEKCIKLRPGMVADYDFDVSNSINFNVHYHGLHDVHYPVSKKGVRREKGTLDPESHDFYTSEQEYYCFMWDNVTDKPVKITYNCVTKEKATVR